MTDKLRTITQLFSIIVVLIISGCSSMMVTPEQLRSVTDLNEFVPIDPQPYDSISYYKPDGTAMNKVPWVTVPRDTILGMLNNQDSTMTIYKKDSSGELKYLVSNVTGEAGSYRLIMDYVQYKPIDLTDKSGKVIGSGRVGIGLRINGQIDTTKSGVDLSNLFALGIAAKQGTVQGKLSVSVLGMSSSDINKLFPTPSDIDQTSIQKALEALAAIKSKITDATTILTPELLEIKVSDESALKTAGLENSL